MNTVVSRPAAVAAPDQLAQTRADIRNPAVLRDEAAFARPILDKLPGFDFMAAVRAVENGGSLSYEDAFLGFLHVVGASNEFFREEFFPGRTKEDLLEHAIVFLFTMRFQEERGLISPEEVAGMVAATRLDFPNVFRSEKAVLETCGMGGDRGFGDVSSDEAYAPLRSLVMKGFSELASGSVSAYARYLMEDFIPKDRAVKQSYKSVAQKTANISTMTALACASMGLPVVKHGSGKNTSAAGSSDAIVNLGVPKSATTMREMQDRLDGAGFCYSEARVFKSIHDVSSVTKTETVNHLVGPLTAPIARGTRLNKIVGTNHNIAPATVAKAYQILGENGVYDVGDVFVVAGIGEEFDPADAQSYRKTKLDELTPVGALVSVVKGGKYVGDFRLDAADFGGNIDLTEVLIPKGDGAAEASFGMNKDLAAGCANGSLTDLLACNTALGLLLGTDFMDGSAGFRKASLIQAFTRAKAHILSGEVAEFIASLSPRSTPLCVRATRERCATVIA